MTLFDTHCHLDFQDFDSDRSAVIERAYQAGVGYILDVGSSLDSSLKAIALASEYHNIYASVGIHPHDAKTATDEFINKLESLADNKKVVAIGEIGLDYYRNLSDQKTQQDVFIKFILLAKEKALPVIIHTRDAHADTLKILSEYLSPPIRGVAHCFSGDRIFLNGLLDLGLCVSFTATVTYKNANNLRELVKFVPLGRLLLETDAPFLSPQAVRGKRNEPAYLTHLLAQVSQILSIPQEKISDVTTENAKRLFNVE